MTSMTFLKIAAVTAHAAVRPPGSHLPRGDANCNHKAAQPIPEILAKTTELCRRRREHAADPARLPELARRRSDHAAAAHPLQGDR